MTHGQPNINRCNSFTSLLLDVYVSLTMFWAPPRPSSGAYSCINSLWFYHWSIGSSSVVGRGRQTTTNNAATTNAPTVKPEAVNAAVSS